jgi:hypothetical protein
MKIEKLEPRLGKKPVSNLDDLDYFPPGGRPRQGQGLIYQGRRSPTSRIKTFEYKACRRATVEEE